MTYSQELIGKLWIEQAFNLSAADSRKLWLSDSYSKAVKLGYDQDIAALQSLLADVGITNSCIYSD